jgi:hypothetical protein
LVLPRQIHSAEQRRRARIAVVGGIVAVVLAVFAVVAGYEAYIAKERADENATAADVAAKQAQVERDKAHIQLLAIQARRADTEANTSDDIGLAGALALESIEFARKGNLSAEVDAVEAASRSSPIRPGV